MIQAHLWIGAFVLAATPIHAQSLPPPIVGSQLTKLCYDSVFTEYRPYEEVAVAPWEKTNGKAAMPGGHMGHAGNDAMPDAAMIIAPASAPLSAAPAPGQAGHASRTQ